MRDASETDKGVSGLIEAIFDDLAASALVDGGLAAWLPAGSSADGVGATIGPSLYSGTAGVALALAAFASYAHSSQALDLATWSAAHALENASQIDPRSRFGFYAGWPGMIYAATRVFELSNDSSLKAKAAELLTRLSGEEFSAEFDVIGGTAGAVAALALLAPTFGEAAMNIALRGAVRLESTVRRNWRQGHAAWRSPRENNNLPLTGFAHGSGGVAWALLELWARRQENGWLRELAEQALRYESDTLDKQRRSWPDLRHYRTWETTRALPPPCQAAWCHGSGGITLARLRAFELTGNAMYRDEALFAARSLADATSNLLGRRSAELCLCHGVAGNVDILRMVCDRLPGIDGELDRSAAQLLREFVNVLLEESSQGRAVLAEPGLMLGRAGLGHMLLCILGAKISALLPASTPN